MFVEKHESDPNERKRWGKINLNPSIAQGRTK